MQKESLRNLSKATRRTSQRGRAGHDQWDATGVRDRSCEVVHRQQSCGKQGGNYGRRGVPAASPNFKELQLAPASSDRKLPLRRRRRRSAALHLRRWRSAPTASASRSTPIVPKSWR